MRGLFGIPTRQRRSEWYLSNGNLRVIFHPRERDYPLREGSLEYQPDAGPWISLLPASSRSEARKLLGFLVGIAASDGQVLRTARLLLRHVERVGLEPSWDLVLSPNDDMTISMTYVIEEISGRASFQVLVSKLIEYAAPISWPPWVPNDEQPTLEFSGEPSNIDAKLWNQIREAFLRVLPLEDDQIYFDLELARLEIDSLDWVILGCDLEEHLHLELDDSQFEQFGNAHTVGDLYRLIETLSPRF